MRRFLLLALLPLACAPQKPRTVRVGAASSLQDLLEVGNIMLQDSGIPVSTSWSFQASSTLSRQVEAGGRFDVILSADADSVDRLGTHIVRSSRRVFLTNRLAIVGPEGTAGLDGIPATAKIAIAGQEVPAGKYWLQFLAGAGRLSAFEGRFVIAENVRAALALFEERAVDYALVFATDAPAAKRPHATWSPPDGPVTECVAAIIAGHESDEARAFIDWLGSAWFQREALKHGFGLPAK